jgi:hypothetical protein
LGHCVLTAAGSIDDTEPCSFGPPATDSGSIDRRAGRVSAASGYCFDGATSSDATAVDRFRIVGPASPSPISFRVVFQCTGSGVGRLRVDGRAAGEFFSGTRTFSFDVAYNVEQEFEVEYHVTGAPSTQTGSGFMSGALRFEGLPTGYALLSCWGFGSSIDVQPTTWSMVKSRYR